MEDITRRRFLKDAASVIAVGLAAPPWLAQIAQADMQKLAKGGKTDPDRVLVVIQLTGGNDGLNTVIPYSDKLYYQLRPSLAIPEGKALALNSKLALHPSLTGLQYLFKRGKAAIVQGVGYPHPNRSHFKSMDIWQTADPDGAETYGWLGRYLDKQMQGEKRNPVIAVALGVEKPKAFDAVQASVPCFASLNDLTTMTGGGDTDVMLRAMQADAAGKPNNHRVVREATFSALDAVSELKRNLAKYKSDTQYGNDPFGNGLRQVAQLIAISPKTRVIYFSSGGFDTHARQATTHERLLTNFGNALKAFYDDLEKLGVANKVAVMVFSEFGRRVAENGSQGTDHGAAAPMFMIGGGVQGGLYGTTPSLAELEGGDLKYSTDFRSVYATALQQWMGADAQSALHREFPILPIFGKV